MNYDLLIQAHAPTTLDAFVEELGGILGCGPFEERESSQYAEGRYFRCLVLGLEVTVGASDHVGYEDYAFWITVGSEVYIPGDRSFLNSLEDCLARRLALEGYAVVRVGQASAPSVKAVHYRRNPDPEAPFQERVLTAEH